MFVLAEFPSSVISDKMHKHTRKLAMVHKLSISLKSLFCTSGYFSRGPSSKSFEREVDIRLRMVDAMMVLVSKKTKTTTTLVHLCMQVTKIYCLLLTTVGTTAYDQVIIS